MLWSYWLFTEPALAALAPYETTAIDRIRSFVGIFLLAGICWVLSENRKVVMWRVVAWGIGLQLIFGAIVLNPAVSGFFFTVVDGGVNKLLSFGGAGATFVFQTVEPHMVKVGDVETLLAGGGEEKLFIGQISPAVKTFAFWILPTIVFFSSLMSLLYYLGVMQALVKAISKLMVVTLGTSGAESLSMAANIFVGQTEAPLLVRPYIATMTRSELMAVMVGGFGTVSGGVLGAYVMFIRDIPNIAGHLVTASIISAPAAFVCAKLMVPETEVPVTRGDATAEFPQVASNAVEAAARGAKDGLDLAINVAAVLMAFVGLLAMFDWFIGLTPITFCGGGSVGFGYDCVVDGVAAAGEPLSMSRILGWVFAPISFIMGVPMGENMAVGRLLGEKTVLTEFIAYIRLGELVNSETPVLSVRGSIIASYALCGFANFASIGIQIGGLGGMAPSRMADVAQLGLKGMIAGTLTGCMTGAVVGVLM